MAKNKIGRNDPCPCGSGKKFKKCCIDIWEADVPHSSPRTRHWNLEKVCSFSTEQIIRKLKSFGVEFGKEQFLEDIRKHYSAEDLANYWKEIYSITAKHLDQDFIWMAAVVLWERLAPEDVPSSEQLDEMMQRGYDLLNWKGRDKRREGEGCTLWWQIWEHLQKRFSPDMRSIDEAERVFSGMQSLHNWCQYLEMELGNAGRDDASFYEKKLQYCRDFCTLFPDSGRLLLHNMKRGEAESYFALGRLSQGEEAFGKLVEEFPDSAWGYIGWGDMYWLARLSDKVALDYDKAERIYRMALERDAIDDREEVLDRLEELEEERKASGGFAQRTGAPAGRGRPLRELDRWAP